jgi:hypothetical protein
VNILLIIQLLLGVTLAFYGASIFRSMPPLGGFILGGLLGITLGGALIPASNFTGFTPYIVFVGAGLVGALLAIPLQILIVVVSGSFLGGIVGLVAGYLIQSQGIPRLVVGGVFSITGISNLQIWTMAIFALAFALLSIPYERAMFFASTGFIGSMMIMTSLSGLGGGSYALLRNAVFLFFLLLTLGLLGMIWQNYQSED